MARTGLVAVQRQVNRDGKTFTQTVWIKPHHEAKVDKQKVIETPKWDFKTADEVKNEVARINGLFDRSERMVLKEELLHHIEHDMGVKWDKVPANEPKAFGRNCLRAFSAAKKHVGNGGAKQQPAAPAASNPAPAPAANSGSKTFEISKQPGKKKLMERPDSRTLARALRDEHGADVIMQAMRDNGITWDEIPDAGPNKMRAMRALATFIRYGGELKPSDKASDPVTATPEPTTPEPEPEPEPEVVSKYEKDSIMYDFEQAPDLHKAIALATGILPTDEQSGKYLLEQIQEGKMGTMENPLSDEKFGIADKLASDINRAVSVVEKFQGQSNDRIYRYQKMGSATIREHFKGTEYEDDFAKFEENYNELTKSFTNETSQWILANGANAMGNDYNLKRSLDKMNPNWLDSNGEEIINDYKKLLIKAIQDNDDDTFDRLGLVHGTNLFDVGTLPMTRVLEMANSQRTGDFGVTAEYASTATAFIRKKTGKSDGWDAINSGKVTRKELAVILLRTIDEQTSKSNRISKKTVREQTSDPDVFAKKLFTGVKYKPSPTVGENIPDGFMEEKLELANRVGNFVKSPEMAPLVFNMSYHLVLDNAFKEKVGVVSKDDFNKGNRSAMQVRLATAVKKRKTPELQEKAKKKYMADIEAKSTGYGNVQIHENLKEGKDVDTSLFPTDEEKIKTNVRTSISTVEGAERSVVEKKVQATHDRASHSSFETKVLGVYRVKRIASEEKFQEINDKINTTGFYYHGTSIATSQKILGESGGFKVFTNKDGDKIKAGSMLGYGIYLASESSKSVQYIGNSFGRQTERGTLFLCKASLGNVVQTRYRGADHNQKIMNDHKTDTVFMDKPDVINPEWAVKRAEQAIPRLLIDVERITK